MAKLVGQRVGAICGETDVNTVEFFGYGVYMGEVIPPPEIKFMGLSLAKLGHTNPKIQLDNGKVVWGCECWWGSEEQTKETLKSYEQLGRAVVIVDIEAKRQQYATQ